MTDYRIFIRIRSATPAEGTRAIGSIRAIAHGLDDVEIQDPNATTKPRGLLVDLVVLAGSVGLIVEALSLFRRAAEREGAEIEISTESSPQSISSEATEDEVDEWLRDLDWRFPDERFND